MVESVPSRGASLPHLRQIDGLRAVAVAAVVLYHLDRSWLPGGFLGVDLFMVLSGFLITRLLLSEVEGTRTIDLARFWQRRVKRLMPAAVVVIVAVVVAGALVLDTDQLESLRQDAVASLLYVANWRFIFDEQSYFDLFSDVSPLRHLWSLAIEEQFYLLFPLVVFALQRRQRVLGSVIVVGIAASALWMSILSTDESRAYYGTDTRAQALLAGAFLAWIAVRSPRMLYRRSVALAAPLAALVVAVMLVVVDDRDEWMYHGGFLLFAVVATVLLAGVVVSEPTAGMTRVLSAAPVVALGAASYSVYLWHWPIIVMMSPARTGLDGPLLAAVQLGIIGISSAVSYLLVERAVRRADVRPQLVMLGSASALVVSIGLVIVATSGATSPADYFEADGSARAAPIVDDSPADSRRPLLLGDSVAASLTDALSIEAQARKVFMAAAPVSGCGLLPGVTMGDDLVAYEPSRACPDVVNEAVDLALETISPSVVIWLSAWDAEHRDVAGRLIRVGTPEGDRDVEELIDGRVRAFEARNVATILVTVPRVGGEVDDALAVKQARIDAYNRVIMRYAARQHGRVDVLDLASFVCPQPGVCTDRTSNGSRFRPSDGIHFEGDGATEVAVWMIDQLDRMDD